MDNLTNEEILELIKKSQNGDIESNNIIVENNIGLVWSVVRRFRGRGQELEDLFQIGCVGLIKAIKKFDPSYNVCFSTYAVPMIMGEIKRFLRDHGAIKVSRSLKELSTKAKAIKEMMTNENGVAPSINELAEKLQVSVEDLVMAIESSYLPESLFSTVNDSDSSQIYLIDRVNGSTAEAEGDLIDKIDLSNVLSTLKGRERQIIYARYFKEETQEKIAKKLGISQVQVSRLEKKILKELRKKIEL